MRTAEILVLTRPRRRRLWVACLIAVVLVCVACGGGETAVGSADRGSDQRDLPEGAAMPADPAELSEAMDAAGALSGLFTARHGLQECALRPTGEAACWGENSFPPDGLEGVFAGITHGFAHVCGLRASGEVECWEHEQFSFAGEPDTPEGVFAAVDAAGRWTCGLRHGGAVECWGDLLELLEGVEPPVADVTFPGGEFASISVGGAHACGLRPGGEVACWGTNWFGQADAPAGLFVSVDAGASHSCGLRPDGSIDCWGEDSKDAAILTVGGFRFGGDEAAYVADQRGMDDDTEGWLLIPSTAAFMDLEGAVPEAELREEMARRAAGWESPAGPFVAVKAGDGFTCGLRLDGEVACWGYFAREEPRIPLEIYRGGVRVASTGLLQDYQRSGQSRSAVLRSAVLRVVRVAVRGAGLGVGPRGVPDCGARLDSSRIDGRRLGADRLAGGAVHRHRGGMAPRLRPAP